MTETNQPTPVRRSRTTTALAVIGAASVLALAGNTVSIAATGQGFILGKGNAASTVTGLTRTTVGPAMKVVTKSATDAPLAVNGRGKVTNLNADKVDGLDAASIQAPVRTSIRTVDLAVIQNVVSGGERFVRWQLGNLAAGTYLATLHLDRTYVSGTGGFTCAVTDGAGELTSIETRWVGLPASDKPVTFPVVHPGGAPQLLCEYDVSASQEGDIGGTISLLRADVATTSAVIPTQSSN